MAAHAHPGPAAGPARSADGASLPADDPRAHVCGAPRLPAAAPVQAWARVVENASLGEGYWLLRLEPLEPAQAAASYRAFSAGQFVMIGVASEGGPLLPRPFSIFRPEGADARAAGVFELLHRVVGPGTARMARFRVGERVPVLGPLGRAFALPPAGTPVWCLGGGVGIPPLLALADACVAAGRGADVTVAYGGRSAAHLVLAPRLRALGVAVHTFTDDGSAGTRGSVVTGARALREAAAGAGGRAAASTPWLYACGPHGMLQAVAAFAAELGAPCQLALEAPMACGVGVCLACVVDTPEGGHRLVCKDGPVFDAREVVP